jgi:hypothetical protein
MLGRAAVAMWWDIAPEVQAEWEDWHTHEHMPERLGVPGFLRGSRWVSDTSYFVLYEASRLSVLKTGAYMKRLNNPSPWSRKMMPHHRNMVRSLCHVRAAFGGGLSGVLGTVRFSPGKAGARVARDLQQLPERKGLAGVTLLESAPLPNTPQTEEQKIRGMDAQADWVVLLGGYDAAAVEAALRALQKELKADGPLARVYRLSHMLSAKE